MEEIFLSVVIVEVEIILFFGDYCFVFVENFYFLIVERKINGVEYDVNFLLNYLESLLLIIVFVFMVLYEKLDECKKIIKVLKKNVIVVDVNLMDEKVIC